MVALLLACAGDFAVSPTESDPVLVPDSDIDVDVETDGPATPERICRTDGTIHLEDGFAMTYRDPPGDTPVDAAFIRGVVPAAAAERAAIWAATGYGPAIGGGSPNSGAWLLAFDDWHRTLSAGAPPRIVDDWHRHWMDPIGSQLSTSDSPGTGVAFLLADSGTGDYRADDSVRFAVALFDETPAEPTGARSADAWVEVNMQFASAPRWSDVDGDGLDDLLIANPEGGRVWETPLAGNVAEDDGTMLFTSDEMDPDRLGLDYGMDVHDVNGDGWGDLVASRQSLVHVFFGPLTERRDWAAGDIVYDTGMHAVDPLSVPGLVGDWNPDFLRYPFADFTGDGEADLAFQPNPFDVPESIPGSVEIAWDHTVGTHAPRTATWLVGVEPQEGFPASGQVADVGDVNGDGANDLWFGRSYGWKGSHAALVIGPFDGDRISAGSEVFELGDDSRETSVLAAGDLDGDGLGDFTLAWASASEEGPMSLVLFRGCPNW